MSRPLYLSEYKPVSKLQVEQKPVARTTYPVIDVHGHFASFYLPLYAPDPARWQPVAVDETVKRLQQQGIRRVINLDGFWDGFLGLDLETVFAATSEHEDFFLNFVSIDVTKVLEKNFASMVRQHLDKARQLGARGIKLFKHVSLMVEKSPFVYQPGRGIRIDDPRLAVIWQTAAEFGWPVLIHIADPECFFDPVDQTNERYLELLAHPDWSYAGSGTYTFAELMQAQEKLLQDNPKTTFIIAHVGSNAENLAYVSSLLHRYKNFYVDLAARIDELGRQYHTARRFFFEHADRILFGTDVNCETAAWLYQPYFTFLETDQDAISGGHWPMTGLALPEQILDKIYWQNAARIFGLPGLD